MSAEIDYCYLDIFNSLITDIHLKVRLHDDSFVSRSSVYDTQKKIPENWKLPRAVRNIEFDLSSRELQLEID